eukprot:scpid70109/ scgid16991/ Golgi-associated PDZ and coiled-coil motif-containing protein; PDZ protein interacting specifically with TC10
MNCEAEVDRALTALSSHLPAVDSDLGKSLRAKMLDLTTAFANVCREAETAVQLNMKNEAMVMQLRNDLSESRATELALRRECVEAASSFGTPVGVESSKMLVRSGQRSETSDHDKLLTENECLVAENKLLRNSLRVLQEQVTACDLGLHCMEKEMSGRIQQAQLLIRDLELSKARPPSVNNEVWDQLEEELAIQRHKSVVDILRRNALAEEGGMPPCPHVNEDCTKPKNSQPRRVLLVRDSKSRSLGLCVAGGKEFGGPLFVSRIVPDSPAHVCRGLYIGDVILSLNGVGVRGATHAEFVQLVQSSGDELELVVLFQSHQCDAYHRDLEATGVCVGNSNAPPTPSCISLNGDEQSLGEFSHDPVQLAGNAIADSIVNRPYGFQDYCSVGSEPVNELFCSL